MIKAIVFDLDDTLHNNKRYWFGSFKEISHYLQIQYQINPKKSYSTLKKIFEEKTSMYPLLFNDFVNLIDIPEKEKEKTILTLVTIFHNHKPNLKIYKDTIPVLTLLKEKYKLGLITNGKETTQLKKIKLLQLDPFFDAIICPEKGKNKPNTDPYIEMTIKIGINPKEMVYVGDNPRIDFSGCKPIGIKTIRILRGQFKNIRVKKEIEADFICKDLQAMIPIIKKL